MPATSQVLTKAQADRWHPRGQRQGDLARSRRQNPGVLVATVSSARTTPCTSVASQPRRRRRSSAGLRSCRSGARRPKQPSPAAGPSTSLSTQPLATPCAGSGGHRTGAQGQGCDASEPRSLPPKGKRCTMSPRSARTGRVWPLLAAKSPSGGAWVAWSKVWARIAAWRTRLPKETGSRPR